MNNNCASFALFLDLSKAFDSVDRDILLHKLFLYGIRGITYKLIESYLSNRNQFLEVNNVKSDLFSTTVGVPQGSIISPLLFLIHINDFKYCTNMEVINFADDTLLYYKFSKTDNIENYLNNEVKK